jgi:hypothetical protein
MSARFGTWCGGIASLFLLLAFSAPLAAQSQGNNAAELGQLRQAYATLSLADHDYKGHRVKAMHAIEAACDLLGTNIRGDGKDREKQSISDSELRQAQALVQQACNLATQQNQRKVAAHLNKAIKEISIALSIK